MFGIFVLFRNVYNFWSGLTSEKLQKRTVKLGKLHLVSYIVDLSCLYVDRFSSPHIKYYAPCNTLRSSRIINEHDEYISHVSSLVDDRGRMDVSLLSLSGCYARVHVQDDTSRFI